MNNDRALHEKDPGKLLKFRVSVAIKVIVKRCACLSTL